MGKREREREREQRTSRREHAGLNLTGRAIVLILGDAKEEDRDMKRLEEATIEDASLLYEIVTAATAEASAVCEFCHVADKRQYE